ncbi:Hypothetical predicted protein, partial [Paramuricea clavata]
DIFIESGLAGEGSIKGVFSGKHYNRLVSCHKVVHKAFQRLRLEAVLDTLDEGVLHGIYSLIADMSDSIFNEDVPGYVKKDHWQGTSYDDRNWQQISSNRRSAEVSDELVMSLGTFVCLLYGDQTSTCVDECRYQLFKSGKYSNDALPPDSDSLRQYIKIENFQALVWNQCLLARLQLSPAAGNGWKLKDGQLEIVWTTRSSAPESLLEYFNWCKDCHNGQDEEHNLEETEGQFPYLNSTKCDQKPTTIESLREELSSGGKSSSGEAENETGEDIGILDEAWDYEDWLMGDNSEDIWVRH